MKHKRQALLLAAAVAAIAAPAFADAPASPFRKPEDAVRYRQAAFTVMAAHFGRIGAMVNGKVPFDAATAQANADVVATMSRLPFAAFLPDTGTVAHSEAKPEVWKEADRFKAAASKMQDEASKLQAVARSGNLDQLKAQFGATAQTCKACHDHFKTDLD